MDPPICFRTPEADDGPAVTDLIASCPPLDSNSRYCNLLQCTHFSDTCLLAERDGQAVGFVSGYILPRQPDTLFIWQVAVASSARGQGVGKRMLTSLLWNPACQGVRRLETTITPKNRASWALFQRLAEELKADIREELYFEREIHFSGQHDPEYLVQIGPF